jgi:hypothetical protein
MEWFIPAEGRTFTAYAKDEAQKQDVAGRCSGEGLGASFVTAMWAP